MMKRYLLWNVFRKVNILAFTGLRKDLKDILTDLLIKLLWDIDISLIISAYNKNVYSGNIFVIRAFGILNPISK